MYEYDMTDLYGDTVTIYVCDDEAWVEYYDYDLCAIKRKHFNSETAAYAWAYNRGYRE